MQNTINISQERFAEVQRWLTVAENEMKINKNGLFECWHWSGKCNLLFYLGLELLSCNSFHYENVALLSTRILRKQMPRGAWIILTRNKQCRMQLLCRFPPPPKLTPSFIAHKPLQWKASHALAYWSWGTVFWNLFPSLRRWVHGFPTVLFRKPIV